MSQDPPEHGPVFLTASGCASSGCVAVAVTAFGVLVRDSKVEDGPVLSFDHEEWRVFTDAVREGEFAPLSVVPAPAAL